MSFVQVIEELYKYVVTKLLEQCNDDITLAVKKAGHGDNYKVLCVCVCVCVCVMLTCSV